MAVSTHVAVGDHVQVTPATAGYAPANGFVTNVRPDAFDVYLDSMTDGAVVYSSREVEVRWADVGSIVRSQPLTLTREYEGSQPAATLAFEAEARKFAAIGFVPVRQNYVAGEWSSRDWVIAFLAMLLLIGIIVLAYMVVVRPSGRMIVTYQRGQGAETAISAPVAPMAAAAPSNDTYACPRCAETIKIAAKMCRFCQLDLPGALPD